MLSIVYINYYCTPFIIQSIDSLYKHGLTIAHEIIVVNNSPEDKTIASITENHPLVHVHQAGYNSGFARGNNLGIKAAKGNIILLLNPDTYVTDNSIAQLYTAFNISDFGACTLQLYFENGDKQLSAFYNVRGGLNTLLPLPVVGYLLQQANKILGIKKTYADENTQQPMAVDWIHGACLMFKKEILAHTGLLDEDFFLYSEEIEWCARIKKHYRIGFYPFYRLIHLEGKSSGKLFNSKDLGYLNVYGKKGLQLMLSNLLRIRKQYGIGWFLFHLSIYTGIIPLVFLISIFNRFVKPLSYTQNILYLLKKTPAIISGKPAFYKVL